MALCSPKCKLTIAPHCLAKLCVAERRRLQTLKWEISFTLQLLVNISEIPWKMNRNNYFTSIASHEPPNHILFDFIESDNSSYKLQ